MIKSVTVVVVVMLSGCSGLRHINRGGAVVAGLSMIADWHQTRCASGRAWRSSSETGMARLAIGSEPAVYRVDAYFLLSGIAILGIAQLMPDRIRPAIYTLAIGGEAVTVAGNYSEPTTHCDF